MKIIGENLKVMIEKLELSGMLWIQGKRANKHGIEVWEIDEFVESELSASDDEMWMDLEAWYRPIGDVTDEVIADAIYDNVKVNEKTMVALLPKSYEGSRTFEDFYTFLSDVWNVSNERNRSAFLGTHTELNKTTAEQFVETYLLEEVIAHDVRVSYPTGSLNAIAKQLLDSSMGFYHFSDSTKHARLTRMYLESEGKYGVEMEVTSEDFSKQMYAFAHDYKEFREMKPMYEQLVMTNVLSRGYKDSKLALEEDRLASIASKLARFSEGPIGDGMYV